MYLNKHASWIFWAGVVLGCGLSWWYAMNQIIDGDQQQMLYNGYLGAYQGVWASMGNTASTVGSVPGSLLPAVVGVPLLAWDSPLSPMLFLLALRLAGFLMLDQVVRQVYPESALARLIFLLLFWLNPWFVFESLLYNPSYLVFCAGLHLLSAWHLRERPSFWWTALHIASIAIAVQLHFSWPLLVLLSTYLFYRGVLKPNWWAVVLVLVLAAISLIPYFEAVLANPELTQHTDPKARERYIGWGAVNVYPVLKSVIYWVRYGSWAFPSKLVNDTAFLWLASAWAQAAAVFTWRAVLFFLAAITMVASVLANVAALKEVRGRWRRGQGDLQPKHWLLVYTLGAFVAALISAGLAPIVFNYWHLMLIFPFALFPILYWLISHVYRGAERQTRPLVVVALIFLVINLVALNDSRKFSWQANYQEQVKNYIELQFGAR